MAVEGSPALALPSFSKLAFADVHDLGFASRVEALNAPGSSAPLHWCPSVRAARALKAHGFQLFPKESSLNKTKSRDPQVEVETTYATAIPPPQGGQDAPA